jgi:hypothetical protein
MGYAFEAATISVVLGAVLSVLLQGRLLDNDSARHMPPRAVVFLRVADIWFAALFLMLVFVVLDTSLKAIASHAPLKPADRVECLHLLTLTAFYPALIAIGRRSLPLVFPDPSDLSGAILEHSIVPAAVTGMLAMLVVLHELTHPIASVMNLWMHLVGFGMAVGGIAIWPGIEERLLRFRARRAVQVAHELRLLEQTVTVSIPFQADTPSVRVLVGSIGGSPEICWIDAAEATRIVRMLQTARYETRKRLGHDVDEVWRCGSNALVVERMREPDAPRQEWPKVSSWFFDGTELLASLGARVPLRRD